MVKQLQHGGLGAEEGVCGGEGHTLTSGGPYSTQHSLEDTQDSKSQPIFTSSRSLSTRLTFTDGWTPLCSNCSSAHNWSRTGNRSKGTTDSHIPHRSESVSGFPLERGLRRQVAGLFDGRSEGAGGWIVRWREV